MLPEGFQGEGGVLKSFSNRPPHGSPGTARMDPATAAGSRAIPTEKSSERKVLSL